MKPWNLHCWIVTAREPSALQDQFLHKFAQQMAKTKAPVHLKSKKVSLKIIVQAIYEVTSQGLYHFSTASL